jgi:hypothetical protein
MSQVADTQVKTCRRGHPQTPENVRIRSTTGAKICIICKRMRDAAKREEFKKPKGFSHIVRRDR